MQIVLSNKSLEKTDLEIKLLEKNSLETEERKGDAF